MKNFLANIFWNLAIWNITIATKLSKDNDKAVLTRIIGADNTTLQLTMGRDYPFKAGDKVLIVR